MKNKITIIAIVLVTLSVATILVVSEDTSGDIVEDFEYNGLYYRLSGNSAFVAGTVGSEGTIDIPEYVVYNDERYPVTGIGTIAFSDYTIHGDVVIPDWIRTLEYGAFQNSNIESVSLPADITVSNGEPFVWCSSLTELIVTPGVSGEISNGFSSLLGLNDQSIETVEISEGVTRVGDRAFQNFKSLRVVMFPESLTEIGGQAFMRCSSMRSMSLPETLEVIQGQAFLGCTGLVSVTIPNGVDEVGSMAFNDCTGLTSVTMPVDLPTLSFFDGCASIERVTLTPGKTGIGNDLRTSGQGRPWCESEKDEVVVNLEYGIISLGDSFFSGGSSGLKSLTFPDSLEIIGSDPFKGCTGMESLKLGSKTEIDWQSVAASLAQIDIPDSNPYYTNGKYGIVFDKDQKIIHYCPRTVSGEVVIPDGTERVNRGAFLDCNGITSLVIPDGVYLDPNSFSSTSITSIVCGIGVKSPGSPFNVTLYDEHGRITSELSGRTFVGDSERMYLLTKEVTILSIEGPAGISALVGTSFSELGLPSFIKANLSNGGTINLDVKWSDVGYDPATTGFQEIRGTVIPPTGFIFESGVSDEVSIIINLKEQELGTVSVVFMHEGNVFKIMECRVGEPIQIPDEVPSKPSDSKYDYEFERWIGYYPGMIAKDSVTFESEFKEVLRSYTIIFRSGAEVLLEKDMQYGETIVPPKDPVRDSDERYDYEFSGWAGYLNGMTVDGNHTFEATFASKPVTYLVSFETVGAPNGVFVPSMLEASYGSRVTIPTNGMDVDGFIFSVFVDGSKISTTSFLMPSHDVVVSYRYISNQEDEPVSDYEAESNSAGNLTISAEVVDRLRESGGSANLKFPCGDVVIPGAVLGYMQVGSNDIMVSMRQAYDSELSDEQIEASGDNAVYIVSATSGGISVGGLWSFITVTLHIEDGGTAMELYYLESDGDSRPIQSEYNSDIGAVVFSMDYLVPIMVLYDRDNPSTPDDSVIPENPDSSSESAEHGGDNFVFVGVASVVAVIAVLTIAIAVIYRRRS